MKVPLELLIEYNKKYINRVSSLFISSTKYGVIFLSLITLAMIGSTLNNALKKVPRISKWTGS